MLSKEYNISGVINCNLKFLSDPSLIKEIDENNIKDILKAECRPLTKITHLQAINFSFEYIKIVLDELEKLEKENDIFYAHFDIDYNNFHIGPTLGQNGIASSFEVKPTIIIKNIKGGGFIDEND